MPEAINEVRGNPGKRKPRKGVPKLAAEIPPCPKHLSAGAQKEWKRIAPELFAAGLLARVDRTALALYCTAFDRWREMEENLRESGGAVVMTKSGNPIQNPYLSAANKAMEQLHKYAAEFGMSPSSRMRVSAQTRDDNEEDPADAYFSGPRAVA